MADASAKPQKIEDDALATLLDQMNRHAIGYQSDEVSVDQDSNLDRYLGRPYGDEEEGRSTAISADVAEVVDWALPDMLEPFLAGGKKIVEFQPAKRGDEKFCKLATSYINYLFFEENNGVILLADTVKTALIQKLGVIKTVWEEEENVEKETLTGLSAMHLSELQQDDSITIDETTSEPINPQMMDPAIVAAFEDGMAYTVKLTRTKKEGCLRQHSVPPEEFKVSPRTVDLAKTEYCAHETEQRRGDLIDMGFDYDQVMGLKSETRKSDDSRSDGRFYDENARETSAAAALNETLTLLEEYPLLDRNGDGRLERLQVFRVGKTILEIEEVSEHPFDAWTPERIPHRLIGQSLADKVKQTAKIKTHLTRNLLDNVYLANNPRMEVPETAIGDNTIDDLLNVRIGGLIRSKVPGQMTPIEVPDRSKTALDAILYMDNVREQQSGITRNGISVSSEVIDPKSATEARKDDRNEQARKRLMVRMLAETLLVPVFRKMLRIVVKYQDFEREIPIEDDQFEMIDPRPWNANMRARAATGLGHTNRDEDLQAAMLIGQAQQLAQQSGMVTPENQFALATKLVEALNWQFPAKYFLDPSTPEGQQRLQQMAQQGDPKMAEVQGKLALKEKEFQFEQQMASVEMERDFQIEQLKAQAKAAIDAQKMDFDFKAKLMQLNAEFDLKRQQMMMEFSLSARQQNVEIDQSERQILLEDKRANRQQDIDADQNEKAMKNNHKVAMTKAKMSPVRMGGKVG